MGMRFQMSLQLRRRPWWALLGFSALLSSVLVWAQLPAAVLLGCMLAAMFLCSHEVELRLPKAGFLLAQGVVGCLMARSLRPQLLVELGHDWPLFLLTTASVMGISAALGWLLTRRQLLSASTAVWGLAPGAASAMALMAESFGADMRLVAFMQYLRVVMVTLMASLVAHMWGAHSGVAMPVMPWWSWAQPLQVTLTLCLVVISAGLAWRLKIPAGGLLVPMGAGTVLQGLGVLTIELPPPLLAVAYIWIGWTIGLRFSRPILLHAWRMLPTLMGAIVLLMVGCALLAAALVLLGGFEPLTAYLATSPGGADSVAIIAANSAVDVGFVMAMQLARFLMVLAFGPSLSKAVARQAQSTLPA
jgi:membrane AbrB-like protein